MRAVPRHKRASAHESGGGPGSPRDCRHRGTRDGWSRARGDRAPRDSPVRPPRNGLRVISGASQGRPRVTVSTARHADHQFSVSPPRLGPPGLLCSRRGHPGQPDRRLRRLDQGGERAVHHDHDGEGPGRLRVVHGEEGHPRVGGDQLRRSRRSWRWRGRFRGAAGRRSWWRWRWRWRSWWRRHPTLPPGRGDPGSVAGRPAGVPEPAAGRVGLRRRQSGHQPGGGRIPQLPPVARGDAAGSGKPDHVDHGRRVLDNGTVSVDEHWQRRRGQRGPGVGGPGHLEPDRAGRSGCLRLATTRPGWDHHLLDDRHLVVIGHLHKSERWTW